MSRIDPRAPEHETSGTLPAFHENSQKPFKADLSDGALLRLIGDAEDISKDYHYANVDGSVTRSYRAWNNEHSAESKYLSNYYKGRSSLFVPKTRSAVRKAQAAQAAALFSTQDVVAIEAQNNSDPLQVATAKTCHNILNTRLTSSSPFEGLPWFMICMGGHLQGQITGVTISKQYWEFEERETGERELKFGYDQDGHEYEFEEAVKEIAIDRPVIAPVPIENALLDPAAPWYNPIQGGAWSIFKWPMHLIEARHMLLNDTTQKWKQVSDDVLSKGRQDDERSSVRRSREKGQDRYAEGTGRGDWTIIWLNENFVRISGKDYHFWSIGRHAVISDVRETSESYPALGGERPYVMGVAQIDPDKVFPTSPVESWQPLQIELNDITNLRLDTLKRSIAPLPVVKRGKNVDIASLQKRGNPNTILMVDNPEDLVFIPTPGPSGQGYTETSITNSNFDELAGVFSTSSVQQSRQLNETVGGMQLMSGSANAVTELDIRVWSESWVEPVLRQIMKLIQYHESDLKMLMNATEKSKAQKKFGIAPTFDDLLSSELILKVNVGVGSVDPMQKLAKLKASFEVLMPMLEYFATQGVKIKPEEFISEVMGAAGYKDAERFFEFTDPAQQQQQPDPEIVKAMQEAEAEKQRIALDREKMLMDNKTKLQIQDMKNQTDLKKQMMSQQAQTQQHILNADEARKSKVIDLISNQHNRRLDQMQPEKEDADEETAQKIDDLYKLVTEMAQQIKSLTSRQG